MVFLAGGFPQTTVVGGLVQALAFVAFVAAFFALPYVLAEKIAGTWAGGLAGALGSGAGFPGLPLAVARPDLDVTLVEIREKRVHFLRHVVQTLDLDSGDYRPSTLQDLYDFTRLADALKNVAWFTRCCVATDVPDNFDLDINTAYALMRGTTKPVGMSFFIAEHVDPVVELFDLALGGEGRFRQRPFCKAHISPVISPLRYGDDAVHVALPAMKSSARWAGAV